MTGYSFDTSTSLSVGVSPIYVGMSKTGNKLTLVQSVLIDGSQLTTSQPRFGRFILPKSIGDKIFELPNDQYGTFSASIAPVYKAGSYSSPTATMGIIGSISHDLGNNTAALFFGINGFSSPTFDMTKTYFVRFEITILLSDNLIQ